MRKCIKSVQTILLGCQTQQKAAPLLRNDQYLTSYLTKVVAKKE